MDPERNPARALLRAFVAPINVSVVASAAAGAALMHSWPVAALGGLAYAALVAHDLLGSERRQQARPGRAPAELAPTELLRDAEIKAAAVAVQQAGAEVKRVLADSPNHVRDHALPALSALAELNERAQTLIARGESLSSYLAEADPQRARESAARLDARAAESRDTEARERYRLAREAAGERLNALDDIAKARERVLAHLAHIAATLSGIAAKLVRLRALDDQAQDAFTGDMSDELSRMNAELKAFEETLDVMVEAR